MDALDRPAYKAGQAYARKERLRIAERYSSRELVTQELRDVFWKEAERRWPSEPESMEHDLDQNAFVAGAFRHLVDHLPMAPESMTAMFDAAMEMGSIIGAENAKHEHLESLKKKPANWWKAKLGTASPDDVVEALAYRWWREVGAPEQREKTSKWEVLKYTAAAREMAAIDTAERIDLVPERYRRYDVVGETSFEVMATTVVDESSGVVLQHKGEIVG